jgi:sorbitol-specific phosphotransferase system component IIBC
MTKPGIKTTEFWLTVLAETCGALMASGLLVTGSVVAQIVGVVSMVLAGLGYTWSRSVAKKGDNQ